MQQKTLRQFFFLCLTLLSQTLLAGPYDSEFAGKGTYDDPYLIQSQKDWDNPHLFGPYVDAFFQYYLYWRLTCDVKATGMRGMASRTHFDGGGHTISVNIDCEKDSLTRAALFNVTENTSIKNLNLTGTIRARGTLSAGLVCEAKSLTLDKVYSDVIVEAVGSGDTWGGLVGKIHGGGVSTFTNCAFVGKLLGSEIRWNGGFIGWADGDLTVKLQNCFVDLTGSTVRDTRDFLRTAGNTTLTVENSYQVPVYNKDTVGVKVSAEQAASGEVCYKLNEGQEDTPWRQTLGEDARPNLDTTHSIVYSIGYGEYANCDYLIGDGSEKSPYQICDEITWRIVLGKDFGEGECRYLELTSDITVSKMMQNLITSLVLDGHGHTINVNIDCEKDSLTRAALFDKTSRTIIKNLNLTGTIRARGTHSAGLICEAKNLTLDKVYSDVIVEAVGSGYEWGGLVGMIYGGEVSTFTNCAFIGKLLGSEIRWNGGFIGWADGDLTVKLQNCFVDLTGSTVTDTRDFLRAAGIATLTVENSYQVPVYNNDTVGVKVSAEQAASGEVCQLLNKNLDYDLWRQNIGKNRSPMLFYVSQSVWHEGGKYFNKPYLMPSEDIWTKCPMTNDTQIYLKHEVFPDSKEIMRSSNSGISYEVETTATEEGQSEQSLIKINGKQQNLIMEYLQAPYSVYIDSHIFTAERSCIPSPKTQTVHLTNAPAYKEEEVLGIGKNNCIYELIVMEKGKQKYHLFPGKRGNDVGLYDVINDTFFVAKGEAFLEDCQHEYTEIVRSKGIEETHCKLCDRLFDRKYYGTVRFNSNVEQTPSENPDYNKVYGAMMDQVIDAPDTLKSCLFRRPMHVIAGWNTKADGTGTMFADNGKLTPSAALHDNIQLYAQWTPGYRYNDETVHAIPADGKVASLAITDDGEHGFAAAKDFTAKELSYTMTPQKGHVWGTICLPFDLPKQDGMRLYLSGRVSGETIIPQQEVGEGDVVPAGTPAIFHLDAPATGEPITLTAENKKVSEAVGENVSDNFHMSGVLDYHNVKCDTEANTYYGIMYDKFYRVETSITLNPYRAYFYVPKTANALQAYRIVLEDGETGIAPLPSPEEDGNGMIYTLSGQRISRLQKGINIINGKKVVR